MHRNPQILLVQLPQALENEFCLRAGIDENDAHPRRFDLGIDFIKRVPRHMARPGDAVVGLQDIDNRCHRLRHPHNRPAIAAQPVTRRIRLVDGGRQADAPGLRRQRRQPFETEAEKVAALVVEKGVQLVDNDVAQIAEEIPRIVI